MPRFLALAASGILLAVATTLLLTGCDIGTGSIHTQPMVTSGVRLTPNPPKIYIAPFDMTTARWLAGNDRVGTDLLDFKKDFQTNFQHQLEVRLNKLAPAEQRWNDDLPDRGWLVAGEFVTVDQGSRALRTAIGAGEGQTTLQTRVYVYDLSISKTEYILSFRTGVPDEKSGTGSGSGSAPSGLSALGEPISTGMGLGSGLKLDTTRTCREIADVLKPYL